MKLTIEIEMDNAAFGVSTYDRRMEVFRIITQWFSKLPDLSTSKTAIPLLDRNGNVVGTWDVS